MAKDPVAPPAWRKPSFSQSVNDCVEVADLDGAVGVRDSKDPNGPVLRFTKSEMRAFVLGAKAGEFDDLI